VPSTDYDELITDAGQPRAVARRVVNKLQKFSADELQDRHAAAELCIREMGISFSVYSDGENIDRAWPFDLIPRILRAKDWQKLEFGLMQRSRALNAFINDVYNEQRILADDIVPAELVLDSPNFLPQCAGIKPAHGVWAHVCGSDLVRDIRGKFYVLEDNLRVPSGVSYMIENREISKRILPELFHNEIVRPVDDYPAQLYATLASIAAGGGKRPCVVVLTPGSYNSAYFEHAFLAQGMGAELVEGSDLFVDDASRLYMKTVGGPKRVDVIYRRIDDTFMDPEAFREDSTLGVPGLLRAWRSGKVAIANAPGSGVADDKAVYSYVPEMVRYYLKEEPVVNNVPTYLCMLEKDRDYVLENIAELHASAATHRRYRKLIEDNPRNYIAQPTLSLSTAPTYCDGEVAPRHLDLRPFILQGKETWVTAGGLTRVALKEGSLIVNSSQGGGSKDTWIVG